MQQPSYRHQKDQQRLLALRAMQRELPEACADFFVGIESQTSLLTRLAYAYDLRIFFQYLSTEVRAFDGKLPRSFDNGDLAKVRRVDIERYASFLTFYYKNLTDADGHVFSRQMENGELGKTRKLASLRSFYRYLFANDRVPGNVAELVPLPKKHDKNIIRLDIDEVARLLDIAESGDALSERQQKYHALTCTRDVAMLSLFLGTGIRVSECVGLDLQDFDFEQNAFIVTRKGGDEVILYLSDEVASALKAYCVERTQIDALPGHENAFFLSLQRRRITQRAVENLVKKYARLAAPLKRKISPHKLRSTFGTNLYRETGDIYLVADVLGHADVNTTRRHYAAISEDRRREAARRTVLRDDAVKSPTELPH